MKESWESSNEKSYVLLFLIFFKGSCYFIQQIKLFNQLQMKFNCNSTQGSQKELPTHFKPIDP